MTRSPVSEHWYSATGTYEKRGPVASKPNPPKKNARLVLGVPYQPKLKKTVPSKNPLMVVFLAKGGTLELKPR